MEYGRQRKIKHCWQVLFDMSSRKCNLKLKPFEKIGLLFPYQYDIVKLKNQDITIPMIYISTLKAFFYENNFHFTV